MNETILRSVILVLGGVACLSVVGVIVIAGMGREPPQALAIIATTATGALAGILVNPSHPEPHSGNSGPFYVQVPVSPGIPPGPVPPPVPGGLPVQPRPGDDC